VTELTFLVIRKNNQKN